MFRFLWIIPACLAFNLLSAQTVCNSVCTGNLGENIFPNGDFGQGAANVLPTNPGYAPGYQYQPLPPPDDGYYTITNNTGPWGWFAAWNWIDIPDNGPEPDGYFMVVNASFQPGLFFERTVEVCENTLYEFSIDVINLYVIGQQAIRPNVAFLIDEKTVCETGNIVNDAKWHTYRFSFTTAPGVTSVKMSLRNNAPGGIGNDLAIDNIAFRACGPDILVPDTATFCPGNPITINAELVNSPYSSTVFQWQMKIDADWVNTGTPNSTNYNIPQPEEGQQYRLIVANSTANLALSNCRSVSEPVALSEENLNGFAIGGSDTLICNGVPASLSAGAFAKYDWSTGEVLAVIHPALPGIYSVTVTSEKGCTTHDSIEVFSSELTAFADFEPPLCSGDSTGWIVLSGIKSDFPPVAFSLNNASQQDNPSFFNLLAGSYIASAVDSLGCTVAIPFELPDPEPLTVTIKSSLEVFIGDTLILSAESNRPAVRYLWRLPEIKTCRSCFEVGVEALPDVIYSVEIEDANGCDASNILAVAVKPRLGVYAPNAFRPRVDGTGLNDYFSVFPGRGAVLFRHFAVYDRWGGLVFERNGLVPGDRNLYWFGEYANGRQAPIGVYIWYAEIEYFDGKIQKLKGDVTLF